MEEGDNFLTSTTSVRRTYCRGRRLKQHIVLKHIFL